MLRLASASTLAALVLVLASAASCKKDSSSGLPPAKDWNAAPQQPPASGPGVASGGMGNPHGGMGNPHGGMGGMGGMGGAAPGNPHATDPSGGGGGGPVAEKTQPRTLEKLPGGKSALGPFSVAVPADWTEKAITSSMRAAQFQLAAAAGAEAELVVYYFGETGAGSVQANLDRWVDQFQQPDGKPSKDVAKVEKSKLAGQEATIVTVTGRYVTTSMPGGGDPIDKTDQSLIAAIVGSPKGPYYFKLVGPKATVAAHGAKFRAMLTSLQVR